MKHFWLPIFVSAACLTAAPVMAPRAAAQSLTKVSAPTSGSLEFQAEIAPAGSQAEPVRQLSFYLLRKSLADIRSEVSASEPTPEMDTFIDGLDISAPLKAWMKKTHTVDFAGLAFTKLLQPDDIIDIPEFYEAYQNLNGPVMNATLSAPQAREGDAQKNPAKYEREREKYKKAVQEYIKRNPQSLDGLDAELSDRNFGRRWTQLIEDRSRRTEQRTLILAQTQYLAARASSDLDGHGAFREVPAGSYWISTLDIAAMAGQDRLQWDLRVTVRPGETSRVELSNFNALPSSARPR